MYNDPLVKHSTRNIQPLWETDGSKGHSPIPSTPGRCFTRERDRPATVDEDKWPPRLRSQSLASKRTEGTQWRGSQSKRGRSQPEEANQKKLARRACTRSRTYGGMKKGAVAFVRSPVANQRGAATVHRPTSDYRFSATRHWTSKRKSTKRNHILSSFGSTFFVWSPGTGGSTPVQRGTACLSRDTNRFSHCDSSLPCQMGKETSRRSFLGYRSKRGNEFFHGRVDYIRRVDFENCSIFIY